VVDIFVTEEGDAENYLILEGQDSNDGSLERTIQSWVFEPALCDGQRIAAEGIVEMPH
jgi:hypothetical protein